jgi:hypothetical protein
MAGIILCPDGPGPPVTLWHYARVVGFPEIVRSRSLWASDTLRMTDTTEFSYPRDVAATVVERIQAVSGSSYDLWFGEMWSIIVGAETGPTVFAACTSAVEDLDTQWDKFADEGRGFAFGLDRRALYRTAFEQGYSLCELIYDVAKQEAFLEKQVLDGAQSLPGLEESMGRGPGMALVLGIAICCPLAFVKNHLYESEHEWRLLRLDTHLPEDEDRPPPKERADGIRFEEVALDNPATGECAITEVMAGPRVTDEEFAEARRLLDDNGLDHVPITRSVLSPE